MTPQEFMNKIEDLAKDAALCEEWVFSAVIINSFTGEAIIISSQQPLSTLLCAGVLNVEASMLYGNGKAK